ncbi:MAG: hypothetical protein M3Q11_04510 [Pseudomonadota bacterium]|nr:hypothetical protein [Pseudomonadota bacterium]
MNDNDSIYQDLAESILEHAEAIARLDGDRMDEGAYDSIYAEHVAAMRSLAVPYVDPTPDFELVRKLRSLSGDFDGVFVHMVDGALELIIDSASRQHKVKLWNRRQYARNDDEDGSSGDWPR